MMRRQFTPHELSVASATGYIRAIDRHQRPRIKSYPIDNHEPLKPSDRDDAVFAEQVPGGYLLHVTIADVAAHIPKDSPLDKAAQKRAFTIYRPPARDPMFPFVLSEDRFSLEHEQERLGLTATIELDEGFRTQNVRFTRTLVESECQDYASASHRMIQPGDDMELLARVAQGIRQAANPRIQPYNAGDSAYMDKTGLLRQGDAGTMAAAKLVQILMIFANNEIANFFSQTGLPFLYRNHENKTDEQGQLGRAEYDTFDDGHYGLRQSDNLQGAYSHCTSPIRRYADLINQRMQHYAMDVVEGVAGELTRFLPEHDGRNKRDLQPLVWEHAPELMAGVFAVHRAQGPSRPIAERKLKDTLRGLLKEANPGAGQEVYRQADPLAQLAAVALRPAVPYTHDELSRITPTLNAAGAVEAEAVGELNTRNLAKWNEKVQEDFAAGNFERLTQHAFSTTLRRAAVTGKINEDFAREAVARIKDGRSDKSADCYAALILSKEYQNKYWRAIKRAALNAIERDPMVTNNIFDKAIREEELHPDTYVAEAEVRDSSQDKTLPLLEGAGVKPNIDAALVVTYLPDMGGREFAAQSYSLGYNKKDTIRHAKFNFIRAYSFGEMGPLDQTILPTPLYAELNHDRSRMDVLQEMLENMDLTMRRMGPRQQPDGGVSFALQVYGEGIEHPILGFVVAPTVEEAEEKAATRILRSIQFKRAYAAQNPMDVGFPSNPVHTIREMAEAKGWKLHEPERQDIREIDRGVFSATLKLELAPDDVEEVTCEARNKDNTLQYCFELMRDRLEARGILSRTQQNGPSRWATWSAFVRHEGKDQSPVQVSRS